MSQKQRLLICLVRTDCSTQDARLYETHDSKYVWEAGTVLPCKPTAIGAGEIEAADRAEAIIGFRKLLTTAAVIPNAKFMSGTFLSTHLVQMVPKARPEDVCALLQPLDKLRIARATAAEAAAKAAAVAELEHA